MLVKFRRVMDGPAPSDVVIEIATKDGIEEVVVHKNSIIHGSLEIGSIIGKEQEYTLVELPRESASGRWRVWVPDQEVLETA